MSRYRKDLTHPERDISRLADETRRLRQELEALVHDRNRRDRMVPDRAHAADTPLKKKTRN